VEVGATAREARVAPRLPGRPLVVGDRVELRATGDDLVITAILPRVTQLERAAGPDGPRRVVVANADVLLVVESLTRPEPRPHLIDRYLVAAWVGQLDAALVLTKADLLGDPAPGESLAGLYRTLGYPVLVGSAKDPAFVAQVRTLADGRVAALVGQSGVGKSTLTRGLTGVERAVGDVSDRDGTGRHTTSDPRLIPLEEGGAIVDTAGVRTLFLPRLDPADLADAFPEIRALAGQCQFRDCRHLGEPGCAVAGHIAPTRRESYELLVENP
jgi:ribosome biogenesis GTPase / thiamine phosphate phosphatase